MMIGKSIPLMMRIGWCLITPIVMLVRICAKHFNKLPKPLQTEKNAVKRNFVKLGNSRLKARLFSWHFMIDIFSSKNPPFCNTTLTLFQIFFLPSINLYLIIFLCFSFKELSTWKPIISLFIIIYTKKIYK